jgi:hypothetical protein
MAEREAYKAADVVVLVERSEELDGFFWVEGKGFEGDGIAPLFGERGVEVDYFFQTQHGGNAADSARTFRGGRDSAMRSVSRQVPVWKGADWQRWAGFGKMLLELKTHRRTCL